MNSHRKNENQIALITGGLGGIGQAIAKSFLQAGMRVILVDLAFAGKLAQIFGASSKIYFFSADVTDRKKINSLMEVINKKFKRIDILVNCAGIIGPIGPFHTNDLEHWKKTVSINLLGTVNACHAVIPIMLKQGGGKIFNLAGGGAVEPFPNFSAYASSKAGVVRFTENLAKEYSEKNIQVNAISPGVIYSQLVKDLLKAGAEKVGSRYFKKTLLDKKRGGDDPKLAADLILFLNSANNKLTGKLISAKWDAWNKLSPAGANKINGTSEFTLRRIDNKYFYEKS